MSPGTDSSSDGNSADLTMIGFCRNGGIGTQNGRLRWWLCGENGELFGQGRVRIEGAPRLSFPHHVDHISPPLLSDFPCLWRTAPSHEGAPDSKENHHAHRSRSARRHLRHPGRRAGAIVGLLSELPMSVILAIAGIAFVLIQLFGG